MDDRIAKIIQATGTASWSAETTSRLASLDVPDLAYGMRRDLLVGDVRYVWARWFLASLADAERILSKSSASYLDIYGAVVESLRATVTLPQDELRNLAKLLAREVSDSFLRNAAKRRRLADFAMRDRLIAASGDAPRCWVCGYAFTESAVSVFLGSPSVQMRDKPLVWVDRFKPMGLSPTDFGIQVDHVHPYSRGGSDRQDNLRLACGWCNNAKAGHLGLYDGNLRPRVLDDGKGGLLSCPRPFWTVRLLALRGRCEHPDGCGQTNATAELSVGLRHADGAAVPQNLIVLCESHNQQVKRYVRRSAMRNARDADWI